MENNLNKTVADNDLDAAVALAEKMHTSDNPFEENADVPDIAKNKIVVSVTVSARNSSPSDSQDDEYDIQDLSEIPEIPEVEPVPEFIGTDDEDGESDSDLTEGFPDDDAEEEMAEDAVSDGSDDEDDGDFEDEIADTESRKISWKKIGCISCSGVLILTLILAITVTSIFYHYYNLMDFNDEEEISINDRVTFSDYEISEIPDGDVEIDESDVFKNKGVCNILLIGTDDRTKKFSTNARADSIMILSLDNNHKKIRLVSLERGMLVRIPGRENDILTHTFRYGGSKLLMETVRTHLKVDVDKYIRVNFAMFQKLIDEVGGVDIILDKQEVYGLNTYPNHNTWKLKRKVHEGLNHLDGYEALQYARLRWIDDDFHRIERQRKVILAIKENLNDLTVSDLKDISSDCLPYVQTNLTAVEFAGLLIKIPGYIQNEAEQMTIPQKGTYKTLGHVDFAENAMILNDFLYD